MKVLITIVFCTIFITSGAAEAYTPKEGNISAIFGPYIYRTKLEDTSRPVDSPTLGGAVLMAIGDIHDRGSLEIGVFYMNKIYFREHLRSYVAEKTQQVHITMGYRHWWTSYISTSLSVFSAYPMADVETYYNDFSGSARPLTSATDRAEYGADFAVQAEVWSEGRWAATIDTRYSRSATHYDHEEADHYGVILGLRYFIQEKQVVKGRAP